MARAFPPQTSWREQRQGSKAGCLFSQLVSTGIVPVAPTKSQMTPAGVSENCKKFVKPLVVYKRFPVNRSYASRYFADVFATTSCGKVGPGGVLSQSSVSR